MKGDKLNLQIGLVMMLIIPKEIKITVEKQTLIKISGVDKDLVENICRYKKSKAC